MAGPFSEIVLLGNLALRVPKKIEWDRPNLKAKNAPEAAKFIHREYRKETEGSRLAATVRKLASKLTPEEEVEHFRRGMAKIYGGPPKEITGAGH